MASSAAGIVGMAEGRRVGSIIRRTHHYVLLVPRSLKDQRRRFGDIVCRYPYILFRVKNRCERVVPDCSISRCIAGDGSKRRI